MTREQELEIRQDEREKILKILERRMTELSRFNNSFTDIEYPIVERLFDEINEAPMDLIAD